MLSVTETVCFNSRMKRFFSSLPVWVVVFGAVVVVGAISFLVVHLTGGGMAGMH